jgi:hypothetical protein
LPSRRLCGGGEKLNEAQEQAGPRAAEQKVKDAALRVARKELALKDELIARYKDMKAKLSVKLLGETLEQHCEIEFNRMRSLAFPNARSGRTTTRPPARRATTSSGTSATTTWSTSRSCSR